MGFHYPPPETFLGKVVKLNAPFGQFPKGYVFRVVSVKSDGETLMAEAYYGHSVDCKELIVLGTTEERSEFESREARLAKKVGPMTCKVLPEYVRDCEVNIKLLLTLGGKKPKKRKRTKADPPTKAFLKQMLRSLNLPKSYQDEILERAYG